MRFIRFIRTLVVLLMFGIVVSLLGCSSGSTPSPEEQKAFGNAMKEDMKNAMKEFRAAKAATKGGMRNKGAR